MGIFSQPPPDGLKDYLQLLQKLVMEGKGMGKTYEYVAFPSPDGTYFFVTQDIQKGQEFLRSGRMPETRVLNERLEPIDRDFFIDDKARFEGSFEPADPANPASGIYRKHSRFHELVVTTEQPIFLLSDIATWDGETVPAGSFLTIKQKDVAKLAEIVDAVREKKQTLEEALYNPPNAEGKKILKVVVFDLPPTSKFEDFGPVELTEQTKSIAAHFRELAAIDALPFTRRNTNYVDDHAAPERASFKKRTRMPAYSQGGV